MRPSRAGWLFVAITFGVGFAALNTGNNLLYLVLSMMLAFLVLSGFLSESALRGVRIERRLPREIHARRRNRVTLTIRNEDRRLASFALVIEDRLGGNGASESAGRTFALRIGPGEAVTRDYALVPDARGPLHFVGFKLSTRFPFGLFVKSMLLDSTTEAIVFPEIEPVSRSHPEDTGNVDGDDDDETALEYSGSLASGLREYVPGDGLRRVNWRQSARRGGLFVGEYEDEHTTQIEVELPGTDADAPSSVFEVQVRRAASEIVHHLEAGLRVGLRAPNERFEADSGRRHRVTLLRYLALVQPGTEPTDRSTLDFEARRQRETR